jgi:hypothetical protein
LVIQPFYINNDFFFNKLINNKELLYNKNIKNSFFYHLLIDKNINFLTNKWVGGIDRANPLTNQIFLKILNTRRVFNIIFLMNWYI